MPVLAGRLVLISSKHFFDPKDAEIVGVIRKLSVSSGGIYKEIQIFKN